MHEHRLARDLWPALERLAREHGLSKVTAVTIEVGMLHLVEEDFLRHSFEHVFEGTIFQGANMEIRILEPGQTITDAQNQPDVATGQELIIRRIAGEQ